MLLLSPQWHCKLHFVTFLQVLFLLDADFMVSSTLNELQHSSWVHKVVSQGVLVVIPAFEPVSNDLTSQQAVVRSCTGGFLLSAAASNTHWNRKEKFTLFSNHNRSLLRRQPGAMTISHSPELGG